MKKKNKETEKDYLECVIRIMEEWIRTDMVKATETYRNWQHDKGSFAFGYIMGLKAAIWKLKERIELI